MKNEDLKQLWILVLVYIVTFFGSWLITSLFTVLTGWGVIAGMFVGAIAVRTVYEYMSRAPNYDYQPDQKYIEIFEKDGFSFFMRHDGRSVVFNVINRPNLRELYVYDNHMNGSSVHADGVRIRYANLMAGYLTIKKTEKGYRASWEDSKPWELVKE